VQDYLSGRPEGAVQLYRQFERLVMTLGEVEIAPAKTRIGFQNRRIFAAVNHIGQQHLDVHIVTSRPIENQRVRRLEVLDQACYVNHLRIQSQEELDDELLNWLRQGYKWGEGLL
jgi:hypothetical protein